MIDDITDPDLDANLEALLRRTLDEMIPKARVAARSAAELPNALTYSNVAIPDDTFVVEASYRPDRPRRARAAAALLGAAAAASLIVIVVHRSPEPDAASSLSGPADFSTTIMETSTGSDPPGALDATSAYADVVALLPVSDWIALAVPAGPARSVSASDTAGRGVSFSYVESVVDYLPDLNAPGVITLADGVLGYPQQGGVLVVAAGAGANDGVVVSCSAPVLVGNAAGSTPLPTTVPASNAECFDGYGVPSVSEEQLVRTAGALLPLLRAGSGGVLGSLVHFRPVAVDVEAVNAHFAAAVGNTSAFVSVAAGMITQRAVDEPVSFRNADGSTVVSMITIDGVLFCTRVPSSVDPVTAIDAMRDLRDLVHINGPTAMTTLPGGPTPTTTLPTP